MSKVSLGNPSPANRVPKGRPSKKAQVATIPVTVEPASLPAPLPVLVEETVALALPLPTDPTAPPPRLSGTQFKFGKRSKVRKKAMHIAAMRCSGYTFDEIAKALELSVPTVKSYLYIAGKNHWFSTDDPKDDIEFNLAHKVVRNLNEALDSTNPEVRRDTAVAVGKETIFKKFDAAVQPPPSLNVLSIKIENAPQTTGEPMRLGATGGTPRFLEGAVANAQEE